MSERSPAELILAHQKRLGEINYREPKTISALKYLQLIYRNPMEPTGVRIRAAIESLPYENPKLSAVAVGYMNAEDFASRLDRAIERSNGKLIEARVIEVDRER